MLETIALALGYENPFARSNTFLRKSLPVLQILGERCPDGLEPLERPVLAAPLLDVGGVEATRLDCNDRAHVF